MAKIKDRKTNGSLHSAVYVSMVHIVVEIIKKVLFSKFRSVDKITIDARLS